MWMSSITCGVKILLWPITCVSRLSFFFVAGAGTGTLVSFAMFRFPRSECNEWVGSEDQLFLGRLEVVVIPQLPAGDDLLQLPDAVGCRQAVQLELALEPIGLDLVHLARHGVDAQAVDLAADVDRAVVHRVAQVLAGVAEDHHAP